MRLMRLMRLIRNYPYLYRCLLMWVLLLDYYLVSGTVWGEVSAFPAGPLPAASAPAAVAVDPVNGRIYAVHRKLYRDVVVNDDLLPTDRVSVIDQRTGNIMAAIEVGKSVNGLDQGIAVDSKRNRVYVTNFDDNTVSVINSATNIVMATTQVGKGPTSISTDPDKGIVYVANSSENSVSILDASTGSVKGSIPLNGDPRNIVVDRVSHLAYVIVRSPRSLVAVNGETRTVQSQVEIPFLLFSLKGIAIDPGSRVYISDYNSSRVVIIDISGNMPRIIDSFLTGESFPEAVAVDPATHLVYIAENNRVDIFNGNGVKLKSIDVMRNPVSIAVDETTRLAYIANVFSDSLSVIDTDRQTLVKTIVLGIANFGLAFDPKTKRLYVANLLADAISVVDITNRAVVDTWFPGSYPWLVDVDSDLQQIYCTTNDGTKGMLSVLSTVDGKVKAKLEIGERLQVVGVNSITHRVYVTATRSNALTVLDGNSNKVIATVQVGNGPYGIAIDDTARRVYVANQKSGTISVIDATTNNVIATWKPQLNNVWGLAVDPALRQLYVTIPPNIAGVWTGLEVLNADTGAFMAQLPSGMGAELVAVNPKTHRVFVTDDDGSVSVIDGTTNTLLEKIVVGRAPHAMSLDQESGLVYVGNAIDGTISVITDQLPKPTIPTVPWDVNKDRTVDILDMVLVAQRFGEKVDPKADPNPDVNRDGFVDIFDLVLVAQHFGQGVN